MHQRTNVRKGVAGALAFQVQGWGGLLLLLGLMVLALALSPPAEPATASALRPAESLAERVAPAEENARAEEEVWVERTLAGLSLRQRVAQLVFPWVPGTVEAVEGAEFQRMLSWVEQGEVGGLIVSRGSPRDVARRLRAAQARARVPLLVVSDLETGPGMRLRPGGTPIPPAMALGAAGSEALAEEAGRVTAREARAVGIHLTLGPVLDVNSNPENPIINVRSFGESPAEVARLAGAWMRGARAGGLLVAGKHFPGHGDTRVDSHVGLPVLGGEREALERVALAPFQRLMEEGMDGVLVGHLSAPSLGSPEGVPASLSPEVIGALLREELGYSGLVITDALNMGAITEHYPVEEASVRALLAGADVLLQPPGTESVIRAVERAVREGRLPEARVEEAARRVLRAKARAGLHRSALPPEEEGEEGEEGEHGALARRIAAASLVLVRNRGEVVPLDSGTRRILHVAYAPRATALQGEPLSRVLRAGGREVETVALSEASGEREVRSLEARSKGKDLVLVSLVLAPHQYRALSLEGALPRWIESRSASGAPILVVSLGSPYLLAGFPSLPAYLLAWSEERLVQEAVADALLGKALLRGRLPVSLPPFHVQGEGGGEPAEVRSAASTTGGR